MDLITPCWFMLTVRNRSEQKVARSLRAKGFQVFVPMQTARKRKSDRIKEWYRPRFATLLFCRFPLMHALYVLKTPGVFHINESGGTPTPIADSEIVKLEQIEEMWLQDTNSLKVNSWH
jgi:transcription antitermination factor NusG